MTVIIGAKLLGLHAGTIYLECKGIACLQRGRGTCMIACGDLNGRYSKLLVCDEVENLRLQMTPESDVFRTRGSFRMALGGGDSKVDLVMTWSDSGSCGCYPEDPM